MAFETGFISWDDIGTGFAVESPGGGDPAGEDGGGRPGFSTVTGIAVRCVAGPVVEAAPPVSALVPSWNAETPAGSWIAVEARGRVGGRWTGWYRMGVWSSGGTAAERRSEGGQEDEYARVAVDTLLFTRPAEAFALRIRLFARDGGEFPVIRRVSAAWSHPAKATAEPESRSGPAARSRTEDSGAPLPAVAPGPCPDPEDPCRSGAQAIPPPARHGVIGGVPCWSQMTFPDGGAVWCSPVCIAMTLGYWRKAAGEDVPRERTVLEAVAGVYDHAYEGYGNWAFNVAYAASAPLGGLPGGFDAWVAKFSSLDRIEAWIESGVPAILSVSWNQAAGRPLAGAPLASSAGHLTLLVGFDEAGNPVMNEPAAPTDEGVRRTYDRGELQARWLSASGGIAYLVVPRGRPVPALPSGSSGPSRQSSTASCISSSQSG